MTSVPEPTPITPDVESELRAMTTWQGEKTALWKTAVNQNLVIRHPSFRRRVLWGASALAAAALILLALLPALSQARYSRRSVGSIAFEAQSAAPSPLPDSYDKGDERTDAARWKSIMSADPIGATLDRPTDAVSRSVVRKSTIELAVPDAREAFAKVQLLLRADLSEFIEASTLTGQDKDARAQLRLRVAATGDRIGELLNQLRALGKVDSENSTGDDVTAQAVDLDARLRNERQVETELLRLLESRKDAQLKDILDLRDKLASVRQSIERLQGQRDTLSRQVSLATILVILRPDNAPKPEPQQGMFDGFTNEVSRAWTGGLGILTQTIAFIIRIAVGGLIWWLLLIAVIAIGRRVIRRMIPDPARVPVTV